MSHLRRRTLLLSPFLLLSSASRCARFEPERSAVPEEHIVSLGFEDVVAGARRLGDLRKRLDEVGATGVTLSVGRPDWTAFPWPRVPDAESSQVRRTGRDFVAEAIRALASNGQGQRIRTVGLVIDVLAPRMLTADPTLAGIDPDGRRSDLYGSLTASTSGAIAARVLSMAGDVAQRYRPASLAITELHFDEATFGPDDLGAFRRSSGQPDWPRGADGEIVVSHPSVAAWRSTAVGRFVSRVAAISRGSGVPLEMDVRVSWEQPALGRPESGHDYGVLLEAADRLVLWNYFGLSGRPATGSEALAAAMERRAPRRSVMSIGLWARGDTSVTAAQLEQAMISSAAGGARAVAVTPTTLMSAEHWAAARRAWTR